MIELSMKFYNIVLVELMLHSNTWSPPEIRMSVYKVTLTGSSYSKNIFYHFNAAHQKILKMSQLYVYLPWIGLSPTIS